MSWAGFEHWLDSVHRWRWPLLLAILALRIGFLVFNGLDLIGDESYYWDWSRQPDWCYYSKPPMVAWLIGASTWLFGDTAWAVRLPAVLLGTGFLYYLHATARAFYGTRAAALTLLLVLATPNNVLANFLMTIDPPLYCFWIAAVYYLRRAVFDGDQRAWLWAGCATALALLSKQAALLQPLALAVFLGASTARRRHFRGDFWRYLAPVVLAAVPILVWNDQHDWVMFGHSKSHFGNEGEFDAWRRLRDVRDFWFYQLLLLNPLMFVLTLATALRGLSGFRQWDDERRFLWLMGPAWLLLILALSFGQKVQGNWPMPFYFTGLILVAGAAPAPGRWLKAGLAVGLAMVLLTYALPAVLQALNLQNSKLDPTKRFKQWRVLAERINTYRTESGSDRPVLVTVGHRFLASQLAFYLPDHPRVYRYEASGGVTSQYEVWPGPNERLGQPAFLVADIQAARFDKRWSDSLEGLTLLGEVADPAKPSTKYYVYRAEKLKAWPAPLTLHQEGHASP